MDAIITTASIPEGLHGRRKMTAHLRRQGLKVSYNTTDRLMRALGRNGIRRGKGVRTTAPRRDGTRAGDLLTGSSPPTPNGLMESIIGVYKTECVRTQVFHHGPYKTLADVGYATAGWVDWRNNRRLHSTLEMRTPAEHEQAHYAAFTPQEQPV